MNSTNPNVEAFWAALLAPSTRTITIQTGKDGMKLWKENIMHMWFKHLFEQRIEKFGIVPCFECGKPMHEDVYKENTCCYSHILSKKQYPEHAGNPENVVIVHPDCHQLYTMKPKEAKKQYNLYLELKSKYGLS